VCRIHVSLTSQAPAVCFLDGSGVLYNNFIADSSSSPGNPNTDYSCAVAATGHWNMARCNDKHRVVCQSDYNTLPGVLQANSMSTSCSFNNQFIPGRGAEYCDQRVWLFVCLSAVISHEAQAPNVNKFSWRVACGVARSSSGGVAIRYALPVLQITSCLPTIS